MACQQWFQKCTTCRTDRTSLRGCQSLVHLHKEMQMTKWIAIVSQMVSQAHNNLFGDASGFGCIVVIFAGPKCVNPVEKL